MAPWVYRFVLPSFAVAFAAFVLLKRVALARRLGRDPVLIRPGRALHTPHGLLELAVAVGFAVILADIALNAAAPTFAARALAIRALRASAAAGYAGVALMGLGLGLAGAAIRAMGESWRIGIDREAPGPLVTTGIFGRVRHPIYAGMLAITLGLALATADALSLVLLGAAWLGLPVQARLEEEFLSGRHPEYADYMRRTGRFLPGVGRKGA